MAAAMRTLSALQLVLVVLLCAGGRATLGLLTAPPDAKHAGGFWRAPADGAFSLARVRGLVYSTTSAARRQQGSAPGRDRRWQRSRAPGASSSPLRF